MGRFIGAWPALVTPFSADDQVNVPVLRSFVDYLIDKRIGGLYVCGRYRRGNLYVCRRAQSGGGDDDRTGERSGACDCTRGLCCGTRRHRTGKSRAGCRRRWCRQHHSTALPRRREHLRVFWRAGCGRARSCLCSPISSAGRATRWPSCAS